MLGKIFGPNKQEVSDQFTVLHEEEHNIVEEVKFRRL
jgi:hypothetical protein